MKIAEVRIHNFRGAEDVVARLDSYTLLVGANNGGKTTVIDAIRAFYEKDGYKFEKGRDIPLGRANDDGETWVDVIFRLSDEERDSLKEEYRRPENELYLRKLMRTSAQTDDSKSAAGIIFAMTSEGSFSTKSFYGAKDVQNGKLGNIVYIPAVSKVDDHAKLSGPSALRDLLVDVLTGVVENSIAYKNFAKDFSSFSEQVRDDKTSDGRSLAGMETELNGLLSEWGVCSRVNILPPDTAQIIKSLVHLDIIDSSHGEPQAVESYGSGFQRHFIYSLVQLSARYAGKKTSKKTTDFTPTMTFLLFEEPEAFLHPPQQNSLAHSLRTLSKQENWQVLCSTHSPYFVSKSADALKSVIRLRRDGNTIKHAQISISDWEGIVDANSALNAIAEKYPKMKVRLSMDDMKPDMEAVKHFLWLNPDRCGLFFANIVLLVEGPTEVALINKLIGDGHLGETKNLGLYVLDCMGKYNAHRFMNLCSCLGIRHAVVYDDDKSKDEHVEINALIQVSRDADFTVGVEAIDASIESYLEIPTTAPHRKPQHVLYMYETGAIKADKIKEFCSLLHRVLGVSDTKPTS